MRSLSKEMHHEDGYVTLNGAPVAGVTILLRFYDGANLTTVASTATNCWRSTVGSSA